MALKVRPRYDFGTSNSEAVKIKVWKKLVPESGLAPPYRRPSSSLSQLEADDDEEDEDAANKFVFTWSTQKF